MSAPLLLVIHQAFFGGLAAVGFAVLFNCRPAMLPLCFTAGVLALATRTELQGRGCTLPVASFFAALFVALVDRISRAYPSPRGSVLAVVGSIPMVPGGVAAKVLIGLFALLRSKPSDSLEAVTATWENMLTLMFTLAAIGTALALPSLFQPAKQRQRESDE